MPPWWSACIASKYSQSERRDGHRGRLIVEFRIEIPALFLAWFLLFDRNAVSVGVFVVPNTSDLPRHSHAGFPSSDYELVAVNFFGHVDWRMFPDASQLIPKVLVECFKPIRQLNDGQSSIIERSNPVVDVF